ncbi:MAG: TOBE-like domain-containing protein, partial [Pseudomonadota bacterium]|nr:TOBE-like domain-containing protein [Pseudomonadota bacterium]
KVRKELRRWLRRLHDEMNVTSVFVTHDQEEAMEVADRIVVMNQGRIEQDGAPDEVYDHPASPFVLQFLGDVNLFRSADAGASAAGSTPGGFQGDALTAYVRPHELQLVARPEPGSVPVTLAQALTVGPNTRLEFRRSDDQGYLDVEMPRPEWLALRDRLGLRPGSAAHLLPRKVTRFSSEDIDPAAMI